MASRNGFEVISLKFIFNRCGRLEWRRASCGAVVVGWSVALISEAGGVDGGISTTSKSGKWSAALGIFWRRT